MYNILIFPHFSSKVFHGSQLIKGKKDYEMIKREKERERERE